jgi:hypothetical protein
MDAYMPLIEVAVIHRTRHRSDAAACGKSFWYRRQRSISRCVRFAWASAFSLTIACAASPARAADQPAPSLASLSLSFEQRIPQHLVVPAATVADYAALLDAVLTWESIAEEPPSFVVLVDRNPDIQALFVFLGTSAAGWTLVGAAPVSTGLPGKYEHFKTPLGVFDHSRQNPDFRAEGTRNKLGIRGYGDKGGRIYDFGWVKAPRGWGDGHMGELRLQMHSTDRALLERRLGTAQSEGCVRMPAELNEFLDLHAVLDQDYERVIEAGTHPWVLRTDRQPTPWSGRYLVVIESDGAIRPDWAAIGRKRK